MSVFITELRHALRQLLKRPGFTLVAVLSLGIGIGANVLLFTLFNAVLLRPPAGTVEPERVVDIGRTMRGGAGFDTLSHGDITTLRDHATTLESVYGYTLRPLNFGRADGTVRALGFVVSESYFDTFGVEAGLGRVFGGADSAPGANPVVVASHAAFERWFGSDTGAIGRSITLNGSTFTLIGVAPADFRGHVALLSPDFFVPVSMIGALQPGGESMLGSFRSHWLLAGGRLAPGATLASARAEVAALAGRVLEAHPDLGTQRGYGIVPIAGMPHGTVNEAGGFSAVLFALVTLVLLVACVNVAAMLLAHGERRLPEIGVRYALGASRWRVTRQLVLEGTLVALAAGLLGLAIAFQAEHLVRAIPLPIPVPLHVEARPDAAVLGFTFALCLLTTIVFALLPALRTSRVDPRAAIAGGTGGGTPRRTRLREGLVVAQIAFSLVLLAATGLFVRAVQRAQAIDHGFRGDGVLVAEVDLEASGLPDDRATAIATAVLERVRREPGVASAALGRVVPLTLQDMSFGGIWLAPGDEEPSLWPSINLVSPGYFATLGIPVRGRDFSTADGRDSEPVVVINQHLARRLFGDADPLDRTFEYAGFGDRTTVRVIGVTPDGKYASLAEDPKHFLYMSVGQVATAGFNVFAQTAMPAAEFARRVDAAQRAVYAHQPPPAVHALDDLTALGLLPQRIGGAVSAAMGGLGLLLAVMGLYGVIAYQVAQRTREFGIRLALGAAATRIRGMVLRRAARVIAVGLVVGLALSVLAAQALSGVLFGIAASDTAAFAIAALLLLGTGLAAAWIPARRAARVEPTRALRHE